MTAVEDSTGFMKHWKVVVAGVALRDNVDTWYAITGEWCGISDCKIRAEISGWRSLLFSGLEKSRSFLCSEIFMFRNC